MKVIILAAGFGKRLGKNKSKGLVELDGPRNFLDRHFQCLEELGLDGNVVLVGGKDHQELADRYQHRCVDVIANDNVDMNNGYSLLLAARHMWDGFLLINCDVVYDIDILKSLVRAPDANSLLVDGDKGDDPEEMKACAIHGVPYRLKKTIIPEDEINRIGEFAGMCKITNPDSITTLVEILDCQCRKWVPFYWEDALEEHMSHYRYGITFTEGRNWLEVDFPEDLALAKRTFGFE